MNIVFMGTPDFSVPTLEMLRDDKHTVQAVFTQPDKPRGRGKKLTPTPVKAKALDCGYPVYTPLSLKKGEDAAESLRILQELRPDLIIVIAYGQILPKEILELPKYGCINLHASLLPRWRGAAPIQRAILAGDAETGITAMQMAEGLDTGDMLHVLKTRIGESETAESLHDRLALLAAETMRETIALLEQGLLRPVRQDEADVCYAEKITKEMSRIDFSESAEKIDRTIRAVSGYALLNGRRVKLWGSALTGGHADAPAGTVICCSKKLHVVCGDGGVLQITMIQAEGGKILRCCDFLNGCAVKEGDLFTSADS